MQTKPYRDQPLMPSFRAFVESLGQLGAGLYLLGCILAVVGPPILAVLFIFGSAA